MEYPSTLMGGTLIRRYKRFFAEVELSDGEVVTAHCPNTGTMKTCADPGSRVFLSRSDNPKRKLAYTWELTETDGGFIGVNTSRPNTIVKNGIISGAVPELAGYENCRAEVKLPSGSRIDLVLNDPAKGSCYVEVKNATLLMDDAVAFPDAVTERGKKHLLELAQLIEEGHRAVMFFLVNRPEGKHLAPAATIDPAYAEELARVQDVGVEVLAYRAKTSLTDAVIGPRVPFQMEQ